MRLIIYSPSRKEPAWLDANPYKKFSSIIDGQSQAEAFLQYMIDSDERTMHHITVFLREDSVKDVNDIGSMTSRTIRFFHHEQRALLQWFWPIGVIATCDKEGHPHLNNLPLQRMHEIAKIQMPSITHFILDQTFAISKSTMKSVPKMVYEDLLAAKEELGDQWEHCMARTWINLYRTYSTT